jgi:hypothetical protein
MKEDHFKDIEEEAAFRWKLFEHDLSQLLVPAAVVVVVGVLIMWSSFNSASHLWGLKSGLDCFNPGKGGTICIRYSNPPPKGAPVRPATKAN